MEKLHSITIKCLYSTVQSGTFRSHHEMYKKARKNEGVRPHTFAAVEIFQIVFFGF